MNHNELYDTVWLGGLVAAMRPGDETLSEATKRITGYGLEWIKDLARKHGAVERYEDGGTAGAEYTVMGWRVLESKNGASAIYRRKAGA